jgi:hypothetical protein
LTKEGCFIAALFAFDDIEAQAYLFTFCFLIDGTRTMKHLITGIANINKALYVIAGEVTGSLALQACRAST